MLINCVERNKEREKKCWWIKTRQCGSDYVGWDEKKFFFGRFHAVDPFDQDMYNAYRYKSWSWGCDVLWSDDSCAMERPLCGWASGFLKGWMCFPVGVAPAHTTARSDPPDAFVLHRVVASSPAVESLRTQYHHTGLCFIMQIHAAGPQVTMHAQHDSTLLAIV